MESAVLPKDDSGVAEKPTSSSKTMIMVWESIQEGLAVASIARYVVV